jgi:hypothetical protein
VIAALRDGVLLREIVVKPVDAVVVPFDGAADLTIGAMQIEVGCVALVAAAAVVAGIVNSDFGWDFVALVGDSVTAVLTRYCIPLIH